MNASTRKTCLRCGECCRKGGPTLHQEDMELLQRGTLGMHDLLTLRRGELVWDQPAGRLLPLEEECIKCLPQAPGWTCCFYKSDVGCTIYENRPLECRLLRCWDTSELEAAYRVNRLRRGDVLPQGSQLMELVQLHEERCGHERLAPLIAAWQAGTEAAAADILEIVRYDQSLREAVVERTAAEPGGPGAILLFLFGRPLVSTLASRGLRLQRSAGRVRLAQLTSESTSG